MKLPEGVLAFSILGALDGSERSELKGRGRKYLTLGGRSILAVVGGGWESLVGAAEDAERSETASEAKQVRGCLKRFLLNI